MVLGSSDGQAADGSGVKRKSSLSQLLSILTFSLCLIGNHSLSCLMCLGLPIGGTHDHHCQQQSTGD